MKEYESLYVSSGMLTKTIKMYQKEGWKVKEKMISEDGKKYFVIFERSVS